ncbi:DUF5979 domain-containing protein, partial [Comamonas odontotermitis]|uniref:DUF5979 domain-containing protein n=1 Tax=Comamonas odontotermitis TaxID=379895 RepID=UPI003671EFF8
MTANPGTLTITKKVTGGPAAGVSGSFVFAVACAPSNIAIANQTIALANATTGSKSVGGIPAGDTCTVTEQSSLPTAPAGYTWGAVPASVTTAAMTAGGSLAAAITNNLTASSGILTITKTVEGGPPAGVSGSFVFAVSCSPSNTAIANQIIILTNANSGSKDVTGIPTGDTCTASEQDPLPAAPIGYTWEVVPPAVTGQVMEAGGNVALKVTNTLKATTVVPAPVPMDSDWVLGLLVAILGLFGACALARRSDCG